VPVSDPDDPSSLVLRLNGSKEPLFEQVASFAQVESPNEVMIALQWTTDYDCTIAGFVNGARVDDGHHVEGLKKALTAVINRYVRARAEDNAFLGEDVREGLTAVVSVQLVDPFVVGGKLDDIDIRSFVERATDDGFGRWMNEHPQEATDIVRKSADAAKHRAVARKEWDQERRDRAD
jgi:DNA gyrase subunit B